MIKFSIVIPAFHAAAFLERSIGSIQAQSYSQWEAVVVDDGSTDDTWERLQQFAASDDRVHIQKQENMGQFYARQAGIRAATGEYVLFLDSDDALEPACLSTIAAVLEEKNWDMILYTGRKVVDEITTEQVIGDLGAEQRALEPQFLKECLLASNRLNSLWLKAVRRELFMGDDMDYSAFRGVHCGEDKVQLLWALTNAKSVCYIPDPLYRYYYRSESVMHRMQLDKIPKALAGEMFEMLQCYLEIWGMDDEEHRQIMELYRLRTFIEVYFNTRKQCENAVQWWQLRRFPWKRHLDPNMYRHILSLQKNLSLRERAKLVAALLRL